MSFALRFVGLLWLVKLVEMLLSISFSVFGIAPRTTFGLIGIFTAPLIHADFSHLLSNSIPLLILGSALFWLYPGVARQVFGYCYFLTNILVWIVARPSIHIGASGLLYGIAGFLMTVGIFRRDVKSLAVSMVVAFFYSGIIWGVLPLIPGVSFESHLMGAIVGVGCASSYGKGKLEQSTRQPRRYIEYEN